MSNKLYYDDPLDAIFMQTRYGVEFTDRAGRAAHIAFKNGVGHFYIFTKLGPRPTTKIIEKVFVSKYSLSVFKSQAMDFAKFAMPAFDWEFELLGGELAENLNKGYKGAVIIIQRDGVPFIWPKRSD